MNEMEKIITACYLLFFYKFAAQNHYLTNNYGMNYEKGHYGYAANPYLQQFECTGTDGIQ